MEMKIALVGDYNAEKVSHQAITAVTKLGYTAGGGAIGWEWVPTEAIPSEATEFLSAFSGIWCVPGSPYKNMAGVLSAIRFAREKAVPFLGTCAGFQHAVIEYARNVLQIAFADHEESNPEAPAKIISLLDCPMVEANETISILPGTKLYSILKKDHCTEQYHCRYGINPQFRHLLAGNALHFNARGLNGEVRGIELDNHPFFIATLFQMERSALRQEEHPVIQAFLSAASKA
jgi:CTP synthase (UTP-ammonia lyase)